MWIKENAIIPIFLNSESDSNKCDISSNEIADMAKRYNITFEVTHTNEESLKSSTNIYSIRNTGNSYQIYVYFPLAWNVTAMIIDGYDITVYNPEV